jgi:SpoIIAA-like
MMELLPDMPAGVIGIRVSGRLRGDELREFKPVIDEALQAGPQTGGVRIVEVIASDYVGFGPGGLLEDVKLGLGTVLPHYSAFKRIAVVSDKEWVVHVLHALAWMVPGELAVFGLDELERATQWAAG